jgi:glutamate-1-semialdehyde 2,1-aminomutase
MTQTRVGNVLSGWNSMTGVGSIEIAKASGYQVTTTDGLVMDDYIMEAYSGPGETT